MHNLMKKFWKVQRVVGKISVRWDLVYIKKFNQRPVISCGNAKARDCGYAMTEGPPASLSYPLPGFQARRIRRKDKE
jgi:hypothetical protein